MTPCEVPVSSRTRADPNGRKGILYLCADRTRKAIRLLVWIVSIAACGLGAADDSATRQTVVDFYCDPAKRQFVVQTLEKHLADTKRQLEAVNVGAVNGFNVSGETREGFIFSFKTKEDKANKIAELEELVAGIEKRLADPPLYPPIINVPQISTNQVGFFGVEASRFTSAEVFQVIDKRNLLIELANRTIWIEGFDTANLDDDSVISLRGKAFEVVGNRQYTTVIGGTKTVFVVKPFDLEPYIEEAKARIAAEHVVEEEAARLAAVKAREAEFHTWSDATGKFKVIARLEKFERGKAYLEKLNGSIIAVPVAKLSKDDQQFLRDELKRRKAAATPE